MITQDDIEAFQDGNPCIDCGMMAPGAGCHSDCPLKKARAAKHTDSMVIITIGNGVEFCMNHDNMFFRKQMKGVAGFYTLMDLGQPTENNFDAVISSMKRLRIHTIEREE